MAPASHERWGVAQNAELRYFLRNWKGRELPTETKFFSKNFLLSAGFFNGKRILEVG